MTYGKIDLRRPDMKNASDEVESFLKRKPRERFNWKPLAFVSMVFLIVAIAIFIDKVVLTGGIFAEKVHAAEEIRYQDVHSKYAACKFLEQHPGSITNLSC